MEWHHAQSPKRPRKFKQTASARKLMASVFWDRQGVLLVDLMPRNTTINDDAYCATLRRLRKSIQNRRRGKLSRGIVLIHESDAHLPPGRHRPCCMMHSIGTHLTILPTVRTWHHQTFTSFRRWRSTLLVNDLQMMRTYSILSWTGWIAKRPSGTRRE